MATAIIYGPPGSGKTVNATLVPGKTLLLCSDNSSVVLNHFERPDLTIKEIASFKEYITEFEKATQSKQYDTVITDCLTDLIDGYIVECRESGKFNDIRQAYMNVYTKVKYFVRKAAYCGTDCIFTCWEDIETLTDTEGNIINRRSPMLPNKIKQQVCGLCNILAIVTTGMDKERNTRWFYITEGNETRMCKDQLHNRKSCLPQHLFNNNK